MIVQRKIGIGDREHVRDGLLCILLASPYFIIDQMFAAIDAANRLKMMARLFVNVHGQDDKCRKAIENFMISNPNHQLIECKDFDRPVFDEVSRVCDFVVTHDPDEAPAEVDIFDLSDQLVHTWHDHGSRFLKGNFERHGYETLLKLYSKYDISMDEAFRQYNS